MLSEKEEPEAPISLAMDGPPLPNQNGKGYLFY